MIFVRLAFLFLALHSLIPPIFGRVDKNQDACKSLVAVSSYCNSATPGFSSLIDTFTAEAPCLCYESATWKPQIYDGAVSSCYVYLSTADPSYISSLSSSRSRAGLGAFQNAPCSSAGDVLAGVTQTGSASIPLITTGPSAGLSRYDINLVACNMLDSVTSYCQSKTPSFSRLSFSQQATCACYSGISWDPAPYDSLVSSCFNFISTRNASAYSSLVADGLQDSPCEDVGDVLTFSNPGAASSAKRLTLSNSRPVGGFDFTGGAARTITSDEGSSRRTSSPTTAQRVGSNSATPTQSAAKTGGGSGVEVYPFNDVPPIWR